MARWGCELRGELSAYSPFALNVTSSDNKILVRDDALRHRPKVIAQGIRKP